MAAGVIGVGNVFPACTSLPPNQLRRSGLTCGAARIAHIGLANAPLIARLPFPVARLERVREVAEWINDAETYAVVNIHWDGGWIFNEQNENEYRLTDDVRPKFESYWSQIASGFRDVGHRLIFGGMNEEGRWRQ